MALIAVHAVINIAIHQQMLLVGLPLVVAIRALENCVVVRIGMADRTHSIGSIFPVAYWEPRVVKRCTQPARRVVARCARGCENRRRRLMNRIGGGIVGGLVAAVAIRRQRRIVVVYMTISTGHLDVEPSQRERCRVVVKRAVGPECCVVALLTGRGEAYLDVVNRSDCRVVILEMAGHACRVRARQIIVVVDVAIGASPRRNGVRVGQRKSRGRVIKLAIGPNHSIVTAFASCGEARLNVVYRRGRGVVILQMA